ncbi:MAG: hypothetical protein JXM69_01890 [Anaerolineae bacterium]|nr:hypothetical protein [Anaerolineae bacterium]
MNLSNILSVAIGLILLYYVLSLIVSYITTAISRYTQMRAQDLEHVLREKLEDPATFEKFMHHPLIKNLKPMQVKLMGREIWEGKVSDIPASTFSTALLDTLAPETREEDKLEYVRNAIHGLPEGDIKDSLASMIDATVTDVRAARQRLEMWYDDVMKNVSWLYTQHARRIAIICALVVGVALDADSIAVANLLWTEPTIRTAVEAKAEEYVSTAPNPEEVDVANYVAQLEELQLPILWTTPFPTNARSWGIKIFGWAITWLAIAQGSSFWYDVLKRVRSVSSDSSSSS